MKRLVRDKKPLSLVGAALILLAFVASFLGFHSSLAAVNNATLTGAQKAADGAVTEFKGLQTAYDTAKTEYNAAVDTGKTNIGFKDAEKRLEWIQALKWLNDCMPRRAEGADDKDLKRVPELNIDNIYGGFQTDVGAWFNGKAFEGEIGTTAKNTMTAEDKAAAPSGEGWVFQLQGYTYHESSERFVRENLVAKLQAKEARDRGFSHACLYWRERNPKWSPKKGPPKRTQIFEMLGTAPGTSPGGGVGLPGAGGSEGIGTSGGFGAAGGNSGDPRMAGRGGGGAAGMAGAAAPGGSSADMGSGAGRRGSMGMGAEGAAGAALGDGGLEGDEGFQPFGDGGPMSDSSGGAAIEKTIERTDFEIHVVWKRKAPEEPKK
jgi:hypothetical protein